ncbi:MAG: thiol:disulfide interchange protein DsbA/DsbL [Proteobacteria bacterium]|nr:thiol:disulfide interchange protein DsbA/DsbL [Pseudomonadota bacterium]
MKKLGWGLGALAALGLAYVLIGAGHHGAQKTLAGNHSSVAAIAVRSGGQAAVTEKVLGMAEESDSADIPTGFSPIAAAVAAGTTPVGTPIPSKWIDGKHYTSLVPAQPTSVAPGKVEAAEVFWYHCPHCFAFDPSIENWRHSNKAPYVEFVRVPVLWSSNPSTEPLARLYYTIEALGKSETLHTLVFREIHVKNNPLFVNGDPTATERAHKAFLKANGVSEADFDKTYRSFSVEGKLQRAEQLTRRYKVLGVPYFVVNGRYTADVGTAGGEPQLLTLMDDLAASERKR